MSVGALDVRLDHDGTVLLERAGVERANETFAGAAGVYGLRIECVDAEGCVARFELI